MPGEKAGWKLHNDAVRCFEQILEAVHIQNTCLSFHKPSK